MKITKTETDNLNAIVKLVVEKEDYTESVNKALKTQQKKATLSGFRPGKVPFGIIKKMYGGAVLLDELNNIIAKALPKFITEEKLNILGEPLPSEKKQKPIDWKKDEKFEFEFDIALSPNIELFLSKKDKIPFYKIKVEQKMINERIEMYCSRFSENKKADEVEEKDLLKGDLIELKDENPIEKNEVTISMEFMKDKEQKKIFLAKKNGAKIKFNIKKAYPNATDLASLLNVDKKIAENLHPDFQFTVKEINRFVPALVNQQLYDKVYEKGTVKTKKEFENKIIEEIEFELKKNSIYKLSIDAKEKLIKKTKIILPEDFLKRWMLATNKDMTEEELEKDFDKTLDNIRWTLIKNKILKEQKLEINEEELKEMAKKQVRIQYQQYGFLNAPEQEVENYAAQLLQNKDERFNLYNRKSEEKVLDYVKDNVKLEEKEIDLDEFSKFFN